MRILVCPDCATSHAEKPGSAFRILRRRCPSCRHRRKFPDTRPRAYYGAKNAVAEEVS
jgi:transposase-like protein